jgi:hypothetical protein
MVMANDPKKGVGVVWEGQKWRKGGWGPWRPGRHHDGRRRCGSGAVQNEIIRLIFKSKDEENFL